MVRACQVCRDAACDKLTGLCMESDHVMMLCWAFLEALTCVQRAN